MRKKPGFRENPGFLGGSAVGEAEDDDDPVDGL